MESGDLDKERTRANGVKLNLKRGKLKDWINDEGEEEEKEEGQEEEEEEEKKKKEKKGKEKEEEYEVKEEKESHSCYLINLLQK